MISPQFRRYTLLSVINVAKNTVKNYLPATVSSPECDVDTYIKYDTGNIINVLCVIDYKKNKFTQQSLQIDLNTPKIQITHAAPRNN